MKKLSPSKVSALPESYAPLLADLKARVRSFAGAWASDAIVQQLVAKLGSTKTQGQIVQQAVGQFVKQLVSQFLPQPVAQLGAAIAQRASAQICRLPCG